jgi:hypothetical protein
MINVVCVKWGTKYGPEYVNRLQKMVRKNLSIPHNFICYTDDNKGLECDVIMIPKSDNLEIYWNKLGLFKSWMFKGTCLYFDLDVVIQDNIDDLLGYDNMLTGVHTYWNDVYTDDSYPYPELKWKIPFNSSVLIWKAEDYYWVWDKFIENPDYYIIKYTGDDKFLGYEVKNKQTLKKNIVYSRLYGKDEFDFPNQKIKINNKLSHGVYFYDTCKICIFNGPTEDIHYKGYEKFWK